MRSFDARGARIMILSCLQLGAITVLVATCAGCGSLSAPTRAFPTTPYATRGLVKQQHAAAPSWIAPQAHPLNLLYVSDDGNGTVHIYSFPFGKRVGRLTGFGDPAGLCSDTSGNVWIVDSASAQIVKYAHGSKTPIKTLNAPGAFQLLDCSVDPASRNLAVTDFGSASGAGELYVYERARGRPSKYSDTQLQFAYFCGYDDQGNLFVDGVDGAGAFRLFELPRGGTKLQSITLNQTVNFPGAIQWDGKYLTVGDQQYRSTHRSAIYQVVVSGSTASVQGVTKLNSSCDVSEFWIPKLGSGNKHPQGTKVVAPDLCLNDVQIYHYPAGGPATKTLGSVQSPTGATVSVAQ